MSPAVRRSFTQREHGILLAALQRFPVPFDWDTVSRLTPAHVSAECRRYFNVLRSADFVDSTGKLQTIPNSRVHTNYMTSTTPVFLRRSLRKFFPTRLPDIDDSLLRIATSSGLSRKRSLSTSPARRSRKRRLRDVPLNSPVSIDSLTLCKSVERTVPCRLRVSPSDKYTDKKSLLNQSQSALPHLSSKCILPNGHVASDVSTVLHDSSCHSELESSLLSNTGFDRNNYVSCGVDMSTNPPHLSAVHSSICNLDNENLQNNIKSDEDIACISEVADALMLLASRPPQPPEKLDVDHSSSKSRMSISFLINSSDSANDKETPVSSSKDISKPLNYGRQNLVGNASLKETDTQKHFKEVESHKSVSPAPVVIEAARSFSSQTLVHLIENDVCNTLTTPSLSLNHFPSMRRMAQTRELLRIFRDDASQSSSFIRHRRERSVLLYAFDERMARTSLLYDTVNSPECGHERYQICIEIEDACCSLIKSFINQLAEMDERQRQECEVKIRLHQIMVC